MSSITEQDRVLTQTEFAQMAGISLPTLRRLIAKNDGPTVTRLSERRLGIRLRHGLAWLNARAVGSSVAA